MDPNPRASLSAGAAGGWSGGSGAAWRIAAIAGGVAAILSLLVGIIAGVGFLPLIFRALAGGLLFGALVGGGLALLGKLLPELFYPSAEDREASAFVQEEGSASPAELPEAPSLGRAINIVLPGGAEEEGMYSVVPGPQPLASADDEAIIENPGESLLEDASARPKAAAFPPIAPSMASSGGLDDLDVLPDLEPLSDSFLEPSTVSSAGAGEDEGYSPGYSSGSSRGAASSGSSGGASDPAALAQAVRTLLKRDQKG